MQEVAVAADVRYAGAADPDALSDQDRDRVAGSMGLVSAPRDLKDPASGWAAMPADLTDASIEVLGAQWARTW
jgi:hypothetical protein